MRAAAPAATRVASTGAGVWRFPVLLLLALAALCALTKVGFGGDVLEYTVTTVAVADHGSPDLRLDDFARTKALAPHLTNAFAPIEQDIRNKVRDVYPAFARGRDGKVYMLHFFGYPALAALPFKLLDKLGFPPFKAFQVINYAAIFVLGLALRRFFGSELKAWFGLLLFLGCGGVLYFNWSSPEVLSGACLLAGLLLFLSDAPVAGGLLGGLAAMQNPSIVAFFGFAPLLKFFLSRQAGVKLRAALFSIITRRDIIGLAAGAALFALPPLFNLWQYGVPNLIAKRFSDPGLMGVPRLASFYFDLNQGMVLGIPAVVAALLLWRRERRPALPALCLLFSLALALPTLAVLNWNSGAIGMMRYALWAAMPILLALLLRVRAQPGLPPGLAAALLLVQAAAMVHAFSYEFNEFSPLARQVLARAPGWYHPEPEIFAERMAHNDNYIEKGKVYAYRPEGLPAKILFHPSNPKLDEILCGPGAALGPGNRITNSAYGWRYLDGEIHCISYHPGLPSNQHRQPS
jgi:hypothetical protein